MTRAIDHNGRPVRLPGGAVEQTRNLRKVIRLMKYLRDHKNSFTGTRASMTMS